MKNLLGSVRGRLLLAFFGISAFAALAAVAALFTFGEIGSVFDRILQQRIPAGFASLALSRQAERIVSAGPALLASSTKSQQAELSARIQTELGKLGALLSEVKRDASDAGTLNDIEGAARKIQTNLSELEMLVAARLDLITRREELIRQLDLATITAKRFIGPATVLFDAKMA